LAGLEIPDDNKSYNKVLIFIKLPKWTGVKPPATWTWSKPKFSYSACGFTPVAQPFVTAFPTQRAEAFQER